MTLEEFAEELQKVYGRRLSELEIENEELKDKIQMLERDVELYRNGRNDVQDKIMKYFDTPWIKRIFHEEILYK